MEQTSILFHTESPKIDLSALMNRGITVRAGEPINIDLPIVGAPTPTIEWTVADKSLTDTVDKKSLEFNNINFNIFSNL